MAARGWRSLCVFALLVPSQRQLASAWDKDGHEAVGMTTMSALEIEPTQQVKRLMHGRDAVDVAAWAHKVNTKYPWTTALHFQGQPKSRCTQKADGSWHGGGADLSECPGNRCLFSALLHFYGGLTHQDLADIDWGGLKLTDADRVKYLINLIGDLHQPLHFGPEALDMGRNMSVTFHGSTMTLFEFWDKAIIQETIREAPRFWWGGWTHVERTRIEYDMDSTKWAKDGVKMFNAWADESANFMCEKVYSHISDKVDSNEPFVIGYKLFETWKKEMLSRILVAGARTAIVLNALLKHRPPGEFTNGTAVKELEDEEDRPKSAKGRKAEIPIGSTVIHGPRAAGINLGISAVTWLVFLQLMKIFRGAAAVKIQDIVKAQSQGKQI